MSNKGWRNEKERHKLSGLGIKNKSIYGGVDEERDEAFGFGTPKHDQLSYQIPDASEMSNPDDEVMVKGMLFLRMRSTNSLVQANKFRDIYLKAGYNAYVEQRTEKEKVHDKSDWGVYVQHDAIKNGNGYSLILTKPNTTRK